MALNFSTLTKPVNNQVIDPSTGVMRQEWIDYFQKLTGQMNSAVGELGTDKAPANAVYIVGSANGVLTAERVVTDTPTIAWDQATPAQAKAAVVAGSIGATQLTNGGVTIDKVDQSASGNRWGVVAHIRTDGVMEVGRYFDFHNTDADTSDFANRLETNGGVVGLYETPSGGSLKRILSAINSTLAQGDIIYFDGTNFVRLAPSTSGLFLQTLGAAANPQWAAALVGVAGTVQATTSGTEFDFNSLPAAIRRVTVMFDSVSLSGTDNFIIQLGDSGGLETTGYTSKSGNRAAEVTSTAGLVWYAALAADVISGHMTITRITGNTWVASLVASSTGSREVIFGAGRKDLSAELDRLRITRTGANTFDSGQVNIFYER